MNLTSLILTKKNIFPNVSSPGRRYIQYGKPNIQTRKPNQNAFIECFNKSLAERVLSPFL